MGLFSSKKKTSYSYVPATLGKEEIKPVGQAYKDMTLGYLQSEPGLGAKGEEALKRSQSQAIEGSRKASEMRMRASGARQGLRGPAMGANIAKIDEAAMGARYDAELQRALSLHTIRESDISRRAAVASGFYWPAENARAAGRVSSATTTSEQSGMGAFTDLAGMAARAYGAYMTGGLSEAMLASQGGGGGGGTQGGGTGFQDAFGGGWQSAPQKVQGGPYGGSSMEDPMRYYGTAPY
jgi:hypothetical protein